MLYATTTKGKTYGLHVYEKVFFPIEGITEIQCDGDELNYAYRILGRVPANKRVMTFVGVNAQEILKNW